MTSPLCWKTGILYTFIAFLYELLFSILTIDIKKVKHFLKIYFYAWMRYGFSDCHPTAFLSLLSVKSKVNSGKISQKQVYFLDNPEGPWHDAHKRRQFYGFSNPYYRKTKEYSPDRS